MNTNKIAFKVVDEQKNAVHIQQIFAFALANNYPVEACFYKGKEQFLLELFAKYPIVNPSLHTNHYRFDIGTLLEKPEQKYELLDILSHDLELATKIGAKRIIIHPHRFPFPKKLSAQKIAVSMMVNEISGISQMLSSLGVVAYIENTFDDSGFYRLLFEEIKRRNIDNFGFCFDMGHAKVWSSGSFAHWMRFLYDINDMGLPLHSHLHSNDGVFDEHLPFTEEVLGSLRCDDEFLEGLSYLDAVK